MLDDGSDKSSFLSFRRFLFLLRFFFFYLLELLSFEELDFFNDESDNDGSRYGSPSTCAYPFVSGKTVGSVGKSFGSVSGVGSGNLIPTQI